MLEIVTADPTPLDRALTRVGDRWSLLVVDALLGGPRRFADLQSGLPGIATNVLSQRLRHLEAERLLLAVPYSRRPLRFSYQLTDAGQRLAGTLHLLAGWGAEDPAGGAHSVEGGGPLHEACGTALEARWWCPTCDQAIDPVFEDGARWV